MTELFSNECRKTKIITTTHQKKRELPFRAHEKSKEKQPNHLKRGKTPATKLWLVLVLYLINQENSTNFLDQSQNKVKEYQCNLGLLSTFDVGP